MGSFRSPFLFMKKISKKENEWLSERLDWLNPLFDGMWRTFEPMMFDKDAESVELEIYNNNFRIVANPTFWKKCDDTKKVFVICHEMCHVMFAHWLINPKHDREWANIAQDIVVNEYLSGMFDLTKIEDDFVTIKSVFKHKSGNIKRRMDYTYYYKLLMQCDAGVTVTLFHFGGLSGHFALGIYHLPAEHPHSLHFPRLLNAAASQ